MLLRVKIFSQALPPRSPIALFDIEYAPKPSVENYKQQNIGNKNFGTTP